MYGIPLNVSLTFVERIEKAHGNQASGTVYRELTSPINCRDPSTQCGASTPPDALHAVC